MIEVNYERPRKSCQIPVYLRGELFGWFWPNGHDDRTQIDIDPVESVAKNIGDEMAKCVNAGVFGEQQR